MFRKRSAVRSQACPLKRALFLFIAVCWCLPPKTSIHKVSRVSPEDGRWTLVAPVCLPRTSNPPTTPTTPPLYPPSRSFIFSLPFPPTTTRPGWPLWNCLGTRVSHVAMDFPNPLISGFCPLENRKRWLLLLYNCYYTNRTLRMRHNSLNS